MGGEETVGLSIACTESMLVFIVLYDLMWHTSFIEDWLREEIRSQATLKQKEENSICIIHDRWNFFLSFLCYSCKFWNS